MAEEEINGLEVESEPENNSPAKKRKAPGTTKNGDIDVAQQITNLDALNVVEYLKSISGGSPIKVKVFRVSPTIFRGKNVGGLVWSGDELITEEQIKEDFGGGKYDVRVERQDKSGKYHYAGQRRIAIAGDPKLLHILSDNESSTPAPIMEDGSLTKHAMGLMTEMLDAERQRADRLEAENRERMTATGLDPALISFMQESIKSTVDAANRRVDEAQRRVESMEQTWLSERNKPIEKTNSEEMLAKIIDRTVSDDASRINAIKEAHAAELRALKEGHREDIKRAEDRADRALENAERQHSREIDNVKRSHDSELATVKSSYEMKITVLESENRRLYKEIEEKKAELIDLKNKKDRPMTETILEAVQLQEALGALGNRNEEEPKSTFDKVLDRVGPVLEAVGQRVAAAPQQQQQPQIPQRILRRKGGGQPTIPQQAQQPGMPRPARPVPITTSEGGPPAAEITIADLKLAIELTEAAINNKTEPEQFASSIQSMVPGSIIYAIKTAGGFDKFLEGRVQLGPASPIGTQYGRIFLRKVEKILIGDTPTA